MRGFDARVTIPAIDAVVFHVMLVTEGNGLLRRAVDVSDPATSINHVSDAECGGGQQNDCGDGNLGYCIRTRAEKLCHTVIYNSGDRIR